MGTVKIQPEDTRQIIYESGEYVIGVTGNRVRIAPRNASAPNGKLAKEPSDVNLEVEKSDNGAFAYNPGPSVAEIEVPDE